MPIRKTASGGQVTGFESGERRVERVHTVDHPEGVDVVFPGEYVRGTEDIPWTAADWRQHTAAVTPGQRPVGWTRDDELGLEIEDSRD